MPRFDRAAGADSPGRVSRAGGAMPKLKTNKSVRKRFKITKKGKVRRYRAGVGHLNSHKTRKHKRRLKHPVVHTGKQVRTIKRLLGQA
jgi:large subunit ribosomal protein L35